ncbi:MAG TPA: Crp/Fnr family transcriptional regulator [Clostridiales bacterium]|nr:Crp/Fnr family transcriptional regulator [Clostridiales bacterium]
MLNKNDISYLKEKLSFWDKLNENEKQLIINNTAKFKYKKDEILHSGENECLGLILIKSGGLRIYMMSEDGREVTLYRLSEGDSCVMSASCILNSITFEVVIDAETDTEILLLNIRTFSRLNNENIYVENFAYKNTVERFSDVMWAMEQILFMSFDKRLATFLIDEASKNRSNDINLTHEQIAKYMGSAREVVSRMLKIFELQGMLKISRGLIQITDKEKLREIIT